MENNKKIEELKIFRTPEVIILIIITCIVSLGVGFSVSYRIFLGKENKDYVKADGDIQTFAETYQYILDNYYGTIDKKELLNSAITGMLNSLEDPYSSFLDENDSNNFNVNLKGSFIGTGIEIVNDKEMNVIIYNVLKNSPAEEVGLQALDSIIKIDDKDTKGMKTSEVVNIIQKNNKETFNITVNRNGEEKTFTITKRLIEISSVSSRIIEKNNKKVGYISVSIFAENTYNQFKKQLEELEKQGIDSLVIDLRENGGGHLTSVQSMIELFLDSSHVIYQTQDKLETVKTYSKGKETKKYPIVMLVNKNSASASEVMTAALKEEYGAKVVGMTTYGKGLVQRLQDLPNGDQYKLTTQKWLTPKGNWINGVGIKPDVEVELQEEYYKNPTIENDNQLQIALDTITK